jgi:RNA polymerase sigma factor for flagellar operon FliA
MNAYARPSHAPDPRRERLVAEHVDMARRIAMRVARRVPPWVSHDDLVAAALLGLTEAAGRYDETRGEPFVAFAERRVRGAVLDELRRGDIMPRRVRAQARKVGNAVRELEGKLGRPPEDEEVAGELGVTVDDYRENLEGLTHTALFAPEEAAATVASGDSPDGLAARRQMVSMLRSALTKLDPRDAQILSLYYVEEFSYAEIGEILGVSTSRVCQLHSRALARLRVEIGDTGEED